MVYNGYCGIISVNTARQSLYNIKHSNGGLITFPGGVIIKNEAGEIIGAIGVSGSLLENDHAVAVAGANAVK